MATPGARLRVLMRSAKPTALVGCPSAAAGREVIRAGFSAVYVSGYCTALNAGVPDIGLVSRDDVCRQIRNLSIATGAPVVADADTGFGEVEAVHMTLHEYARSGAGAFHIEDQVFPKRCGHLSGKQVVPAAHFVDKIKAAVAARETSCDQSFVVIARSDAMQVEGFDGMVSRCRQYAEAGADALFPEALSSLEEFQELATAMSGVKLPSGERPMLVANMTEFGKTHRIKLDDFGKAGYHAVIYPVSIQRVQQQATRLLVQSLAESGHTWAGPPLQSQAVELAMTKYRPGDVWQYPQPGYSSPASEEMAGAWAGWAEA
eukprot:TRINITY_DN11761_c0_g1_i1.p1 TRINITY_DN11761_c0_g1~~TRINITY_DN11761_c0_g1_i1.p1  ORF type:complete len:335 (+),score=47.27 TRINITY_DN11761_c0_g1_i1:53-1006(+)